jgi:hypothetical protein
MQAIALRTTYPPDELHAADAIVASLADVKAELRGETILLHLAPMPMMKS